MGETPKKIVESSFKCFICSSASLKNNKILIFGKSSLDIAGAIRSSLSVDVSRYSENSDLFVCRDKCYQRLIKFQRASDKLKELKREIEEVFNAREKHREKRLLQSNKGNIISGEEGAINAATPARGKASKSLRFSDTLVLLPEMRMLMQRQFMMAERRWFLVYLRFRVIPMASSCVLFKNSQLNCSGPRLTSTPISSNHSSTYDLSQVRVSIKYPSKIVNKHLSTVYQPVGKALSHGSPSQIARAIMKCQPLRQHVTQKMLKIVSKEVTGLCSKSKPSLLRESGKKDLLKFNLGLVCNEWRERAPVSYSFLLTTCINKRTKDSTWFGSLALAGSILLKQKNAEMSATASLMGVLLKSKSIEVCLSFYKFFSLHCNLPYLSMIHLGTLL